MKKIVFLFSILLAYSTANSQSTISYSVSGSNFGAPNISIQSLYWKFIPSGEYLISAITQNRYTAYKNANGAIRQIDFGVEGRSYQNSYIHIDADFYRFIYYTADSLFVFYTDRNLVLLSSIRANIANIEKITPIGDNAYALLQRNNLGLNVVFLNATLNQTRIIGDTGLRIRENSQLYLKEIDANSVYVFGPVSDNSYGVFVYSSTGDQMFSANIGANSLHTISTKLYGDDTILFTGIFSGTLSYNGATIASTILPTDNRLFVFGATLNGNIAVQARTSLYSADIPEMVIPAGVNSAVTIRNISNTQKRLSKVDVSPFVTLWQFDVTGSNFSITQVDAANDSTVFFSGNVSGTVSYGGTQLTSQGTTDAFYIRTTDRRPVTSLVETTESIKSTPVIENISPNPSNPISIISYSMPYNDNVVIEVLDINGRVVKTVERGPKTAGSHTVAFDGSKLSSGVYFVRLSHSKGFQSHKITLIK